MASEKADSPSPLGYNSAAWFLDCEVAAILAVAAVESGPMGAFNDDGSPVILFEPHVFSRLTRGRFDGQTVTSLRGPAAQLSYAKWRPGQYGPNSVQHIRLTAAATFDREAALKSASWGKFQLLGENFSRCGFMSVQAFVNAMYRSADDHLRAFIMFIQRDQRLVEALRSKDWQTFARYYNGPGFAANRYDTKMAEEYARLKGMR